MWWFPVLALCLAATALIDIAFALYGLARTEFFWPSAFCVSAGGLSAVLMAIVFLDFDASSALYVALGALSAASLITAVSTVRKMV